LQTTTEGSSDSCQLGQAQDELVWNVTYCDLYGVKETDLKNEDEELNFANERNQMVFAQT
jgi:hypothetical protein